MPTTVSMILSTEQQAAMAAVQEWLYNSKEQVFRLFGYAGTGKTTLARELAAGVKGEVLFGSFTGKASYVMRQKGCYGARTLHSLIYHPKDKSRARLKELILEREREEAKTLSDAFLLRKLDSKIDEERENLSRPSFTLNHDSELTDASLLIVDEVSMVDERMALDLLSFGTRLLVLGDPAQLPPVRNEGYFTKDKPDVMLTEVHRHGSGILELATRIRNGESLEGFEAPDVRIVNHGDLTIEEIVKFDQIIVGKNATRRSFNQRIREHLGRENSHPEPGDKLVCLKNNSETGLLNGGLWTVEDVFPNGLDTLLLNITDGEDRLTVPAFTHYFEGREPEPGAFRDAEHFTYGYALTCHKAQGSQWSSVLVKDESYVFRANSRSWRYTACTRASETLTVIRA